MGASQSTERSFTLVNDEAEGVITISDSVMKRLKDELTSQQGNSSGTRKETEQVAAAEPAQPAEPVAPPPPPPAPEPEPVHEPPPPPQPEPEAPPPPPPEEMLPPVPPLPPPIAAPPQQQIVQQPELKLQRPIIQYIEEPSLTSLKVRAEKEQELAETDRYWRNRINEFEKEQSVIASLQSASMSQALKEMSEQVSLAPVRPLCVDNKKAITDCLAINPKTPLNCSHLIKEFSKCVDNSRLLFANRSG